MRGQSYSYSERQVYIYQFIKRIGATPEAVIELKYGFKAVKDLIRLKQFGYIRSLDLKGVRFWLDYNSGYFDPAIQEIKAWFIVRLEKAGGKYENDYGLSPKGSRFTLKFTPRCVYVTDETNRKFRAELEDLQKFPLEKCLKWGK